MFAGFEQPASGNAETCSFSMLKHPTEAKRLTGYLPEGAPSYGEMTPCSSLFLLRKFMVCHAMRPPYVVTM
jgi:ABC-2 type transport system ATP-binding protein